MAEDAMEEDASEPGPSTVNQHQAVPVSVSTCATCISSVANLQTNTFYCDSEEVLYNANIMNFQPLQDAAKVVALQTLSFKLLHYFGPFKSSFGTNYVFIASCESDDSRNTLVSHNVTSKENVPTDNYLNKTFKIKNFMTISSKDVSFECDDTDCEISQKPLHEIAIVTCPTFSSVLKFYESFRELTKLRELVFPANMTQPFNFANVMGFVETVEHTSNMGKSFTISEEGTKSSRIELVSSDIEQLKLNPQQNRMVSSPNNRHIIYPALKKGDLVCIHDLCLGTDKVYAIQDQLFVIDSYKNNLILQDSPLSDNEIMRIHELLTESANSLVRNPKQYMIGNLQIFDFCGQVIAKKEKHATPRSVELFLQLPYKAPFPTFLSDKTEFIFEHISSYGLQKFAHFTHDTIKKLMNDNRLVYITLFGDYASSTDSINFPDLVYLSNVHMKKYSVHDGFYLFTIHEGPANGRGCFAIDNDSVLGEKILKNIEELNKEYFPPPPNDAENLMSEEEYEQYFDEEILSRYNDNENVENTARIFKKQSSLLTNSFNDIVRANIRETSFYGDRAFIRCYISEQTYKQVNSFDEMMADIAKMREETLVADQSTSSNDLSSNELFFRIPARIVNYEFEDENGSPIDDMYTFRKKLIKFSCSNSECNNLASYLSIAPQIRSIVASDDDDQPNTSICCPKCKTDNMELYLTLKFTIEDSSLQQLECVLTSPQAEEFIGITSQQLMFTHPNSRNICTAVAIFLREFCPYRRFSTSTPKTRFNFSASGSTHSPLENSNLELVIQYAQKESSNESTSAESDAFSDFRIFGIYELPST